MDWNIDDEYPVYLPDDINAYFKNSKHLAIGGNTESRRQGWITPSPFYNALVKRHGEFTIDAAASAANTKCERFWTKEDDALAQPWNSERIFCNPPFSEKEEFLEKAYAECIHNGVDTVMVLPADTSVAWFHRWSHLVPVEFVEGRVPFISEDPERPKSGNNKGTVLFLFKPELVNVPDFEPVITFWKWRQK